MEGPAAALRLAPPSTLDRVHITLERLMVQYDPPHSVSKHAEDLDRRLSPPEAAPTVERLRLLFAEARHDETGPGRAETGPAGKEGLVSKWRQKERLKTTAVALVMCLNISVDPPDIIKVSPCARAECWIDPLSMAPQKALDAIGKQLQSQYERWQPRAKYKMHLDPTTEDVKKLAVSSRRTAKNERVLFHYNGHGVPRPTVNGEIWVFNKNYTQYIPLSLYDLQIWVGTPAIYVFDCSSAGQILTSFKQFMFQRQQEADGFATNPGAPEAPNLLRDSILLCACGEHEILPQNADLPADLFTACLTTPIKVALRWFSGRSRLKALRADRDLVDRLPGKQTDRRTPTGELNWIFTAITDTIAWNVLPRALFQRLFRQDLLLASLFRNYLLAERVMRAHGCTPVCHPRLPPTHQHPMWQAWDLAAEMCLLQMPDVINNPGKVEYKPSPFFSEQLTAFELWLEHGAKDKSPPEQLPIVLQVLLSQVHRLRALVLLGRFLDMGYWAVDLALSVGIFPYVLKLLQTTAPDLRQTLVFIWTKILAWDSNTQVQTDLVKDGGHLYFLKHLEAREPGSLDASRAHAAFVLAAVCDGHPRGQALLAGAGMLQVAMGKLPGVLAGLQALRDGDRPSGLGGGAAAIPSGSSPVRPPAARELRLLAKWLLLSVGKLTEGQASVTAAILGERHHELAVDLLAGPDTELRAAAVFLLGCLIEVPGHGPTPSDAAMGDTEGTEGGAGEAERLVRERELTSALLTVVYDASPLVRAEVAVALARVASAHSLFFQDAVHVHQRTAAQVPMRAAAAGQSASSVGAPAGGSAPPGIARGTSGSGASEAEAAMRPGPRVGSEQGLATGGGADALATNGVSLRERASSPAPGGSAAARGGVLALGGDAAATGPRAPAPAQPRAGSLPLSSRRDASSGSSPGVRVRGDDAFEPLLRVGLGDDEASSATSGVYASADAARVGGGLYAAVVEALCTLSTDPSPRVARSGRAALRAVGIEIVLVNGSAEQAGGTAGTSTPPNGTVPGSGSASPKPPAGGAPSPSVANSAGAGGLLPKVWQPRAWRVGPGAPAPPRPASSAIPTASPHTSPPRSATMASTRPSYMLRRLVEDPHVAEGAGTTRRAYAVDERSAPERHSHHSTQAPAPRASSGSRRGPAGHALPTSPAYRDAAAAFTFPLLAPQSSESPGPPHAKWLLEPDAERVEGREAYREEHRRSLDAMCAPDRKLRMSDLVNPVNSGAERVEALCLDPIRSLLVTADAEGYLRVTNSTLRKGATAPSKHPPPSDVQNHFHVVTGHPPVPSGSHSPRTTVRSLHVLNELCSSLVMACAADGAVRVWRNFTQAHVQQLASAWQAVMVSPPGAPSAPASYDWDERQRRLHATGGRLAGRIYTWDLESESCISQFATRPGASNDPADRLEHLSSYTDSQLLAGADTQGTVWLFDVRSGSAPVGSLQPGLGRLVGMVSVPGAVGAAEHTGVVGSPDGKLAFVDARMVGDSRLEAGVWKTVEAHGKGNMTALAVHPNEPLLATATANQVVKVWNPQGENVGVIRTQTSFLSHRPGPLTCLSWKAYDPVLAAGGQDTIVAIYHLEDATRQGDAASLSTSTSDSGFGS